MSKPRIFLCARIPESAEAYLGGRSRLDIYKGKDNIRRAELIRVVRNAEGLIPTVTEPVTGEIMDAAPDLRVIANYGVGYNNIDVDAATERGLPVTNTPGVLTDTTADLAFALILAAGRRIAEGDRFVRSGKWKGWQPTQMLGQDIHGKTLGILGMGQIGRAVTRRAHGFGMKILYNDPRRLPAGEERKLGARYSSFASLLKRSDIVTIHTLLTAETRHLIGTAELRMMKPTAILVNAARGPIVDERALTVALRAGRIQAAGLDVFEEEPFVDSALRKLENVVLLPHLGSASLETRTAMGMLAAKNCLAALSGKKPPNLVNPEVWKNRRKAAKT